MTQDPTIEKRQHENYRSDPAALLHRDLHRRRRYCIMGKQSSRVQDAGHSIASQGASIGEPGATKNVSRTVAIYMFDAMRFSSAALTFAQGETVRLHIVNKGKLQHEFVLGTRQEIDEHEDMMRKMPGMVHAHASSVSVTSGMSADIVWKFSQPGRFLYACLIPGHHEAGMQGIVTVTGRVSR